MKRAYVKPEMACVAIGMESMIAQSQIEPEVWRDRQMPTSIVGFSFGGESEEEEIFDAD